jgi:hypothetical protein
LIQVRQEAHGALQRARRGTLCSAARGGADHATRHVTSHNTNDLSEPSSNSVTDTHQRSQQQHSAIQAALSDSIKSFSWTKNLKFVVLLQPRALDRSGRKF